MVSIHIFKLLLNNCYLIIDDKRKKSQLLANEHSMNVVKVTYAVSVHAHDEVPTLCCQYVDAGFS